MEIKPDIEMIQTAFLGRPLNVVLFRGEKNALVDTGIAGTPSEGIFPEFKRIGFDVKNLTFVFVTHAHADHFGGNEEIWLASDKKVRFFAHHLDQPWIENPPYYTRKSYSHYVDSGVMSNDDLEMDIKISGNGVKIDIPLKGGEFIELGNGLELEIFFLPGHSQGNISILEKKNKVLTAGETVCGIAQYDTEGKIVSVPYYQDVEIYLETIRNFARIDFELVILSHLPVMEKREVIDFMKKSINFILRFDNEVKDRVKSAKGKQFPIEIWSKLDNLWDQFKPDTGMYMLLENHLKSLLKREVFKGSFEDGFEWNDDSKDRLESLCEEVLQSIPEV